MNKAIIKLGLALSISASASILPHSAGQIVFSQSDIKTDIQNFLDKNSGYVTGTFSNTGIESLEIINIQSTGIICEILTELGEKSWINTLKSLYITNSKLKETVQVLANVLIRLPQLQILNLENNKLKSAEIKVLVRALPYLSQLRTLDLSNNWITEAGAQALAGVLPELPQLQTLDLKENLIENVGTRMLVDALLAQLQSLDLRDNHIITAVAQELKDRVNIELRI